MDNRTPPPTPHEFDGGFDGVNCGFMFEGGPGPRRVCERPAGDAVHDPYYR